MRFSIIIPVYNVEKYIRRCMQSVMEQSFDDYEVIVVDDETPDNSMQIVQEFVERYPGKIHTVRQKNTRQGGARNRGVSMARGEYILFLDSDDFVSTDLLKTVDRYLRETPCDMLVFRHAPVTEDGIQGPSQGYVGIKPGMYGPLSHRELLSLASGVCNKAYRRDFYLETGVKFPEKLLYEDGIIRLVYAKANSVRICEDCLYYYVQSANSTTRQKPTERILDILKVNEIVASAFREAGLWEAYKDYLECTFLKAVILVADAINKADINSPLQIRLADYLKTELPDYRLNPYLDEELLCKANCLLEHRFRMYHWKVFTLPEMKAFLLKSDIVAALNNVRRKIRDGRS